MTAPEPIGVAELKELVLHAIAGAFGDRPLDIETATMALAQASFDLKMIHLRTVSERSSQLQDALQALRP